MLRDTARLSQRYPPIARYGVLVSQHGQLGAIPPPPFLSLSPFESMRSGGAIPPPQKGYLSDTCAIPYDNKANGCDTPLCDTISQGYCAIWGVFRTGPLRQLICCVAVRRIVGRAAWTQYPPVNKHDSLKSRLSEELQAIPGGPTPPVRTSSGPLLGKVLDTLTFLRHIVRATLSLRPKCSHGCISLKEFPLEPVLILKHTTQNSTEQTSMRTKWFKHIAMQIVQEHLLPSTGPDLDPILT